MDITTLYNMVKAAAEAATNSANLKTQPVNSDFMLYGTYPVYVQEYNDLLVHVYKLCGKEAQELFPHINLGEYMNPADTLGSFWKEYLDLAVVKLNTLAAYLQSKIPPVRKEMQAVMDFITANLCPSIFEKPKNGRELPKIIKVMFPAAEDYFRRELITIHELS